MEGKAGSLAVISFPLLFLSYLQLLSSPPLELPSATVPSSSPPELPPATGDPGKLLTLQRPTSGLSHPGSTASAGRRGRRMKVSNVGVR